MLILNIYLIKSYNKKKTFIYISYKLFYAFLNIKVYMHVHICLHITKHNMRLFTFKFIYQRAFKTFFLLCIVKDKRNVKQFNFIYYDYYF